MDTLGKRFHVNFLGYAHWFISIKISQMKDHSISVDQARYDNSIVAKYLDTAKVKASTMIYKTKLPSDMILTKDDTSTPVMNKLRILLGNSAFITELTLVH